METGRIAPRKRAALALGVLAWLGLACGGDGATPVQADAERPDVLLIVVDTLRADHLSAYGYERRTTPRLDELAAEGTRYTRAYSPAPWTTPAMGALMTSRHPSELGIASASSRLPDDVELLPELLQRAGFATGAIVSHSFCSRKWGFGRGFDHFDESNIRGHMATTSPRISDLAIEWLGAREEEEPFFLFLHYFDPHFAYVEQPDFPFRDPETVYQGKVHSGVLPNRFIEQGRRAEVELGPEDLAEIERLYDSEIALTDREIGRVLDFLRARGRLDRTLVIVTGDHGEEFLDHGSLEHTKTLYDELVRVPLLVRFPGRAPAVDARLASLIDLHPTILDAVGLPPGNGLRGRSLLAPAEADRILFLETARIRNLRAAVAGRHKLILDTRSGRTELYDLEADPGEREDLSERLPERRASLRAALEDFAAGRVRGDAPDVELSDEERERLRALGYL